MDFKLKIKIALGYVSILILGALLFNPRVEAKSEKITHKEVECQDDTDDYTSDDDELLESEQGEPIDYDQENLDEDEIRAEIIDNQNNDRTLLELDR